MLLLLCMIYDNEFCYANQDDVYLALVHLGIEDMCFFLSRTLTSSWNCTIMNHRGARRRQHVAQISQSPRCKKHYICITLVVEKTHKHWHKRIQGKAAERFQFQDIIYCLLFCNEFGNKTCKQRKDGIHALMLLRPTSVDPRYDTSLLYLSIQ